MLSIPKSYWQLLCAVCSNPDRASHHSPLIAAFPHEFMARLVGNLPRKGDKASRLQVIRSLPTILNFHPEKQVLTARKGCGKPNI